MTRFPAWFVLGIALVCPPSVQPQNGSAQTVSVDYTLRVRDPLLHFYDVQMEISGIRASSADVAMPAWSPGTYAIRDHARNVQQFEALSAKDEALQSEKIDKQTWRISKPAGENFKVRYRVYSTNLNDEMADLVPATVFMYVVGQTQAPVSLRYELPGSWSVYTGLEERGNRYHGDYDTLVDSPAFLGEFKVIQFKANNGVSYRVVLSNPRVQLTEMQIVADLEDLVAAAETMFGSAPYKDYTFLVRVQPLAGASSLGYLNSARIAVGENDFVNQSGYAGFLNAATQGFVQGWVGKRIRAELPGMAGRYDYSKESYSRLLWFTEGVSAYCAEMLLLRARISVPAEVYNRASNEIRALQDQPGRRLMSLEDASWNVWIRSDNGADSAISHVLKGKIAGLLLDAEIRTRTQGKRSLDDVMKYLLANFAYKGLGLPAHMLPEAIRTATTVDTGEFFEQVIRGRNDIDYNRYLAGLGLSVSNTRTPATIQFGIEFERIEANQARVRRVLPGSAAAAARLDAGDILLAIDSERVTFDNITARIHSKRVGRPVSLTVLRGDRLLSLNITPRQVQSEAWTVGELFDAPPLQVRLRTQWLGLQ